MALARARSMVFVCSAVLSGVCMMLAGGAHAQTKRSLTGTNLRFQIGGELQIPIAGTKLTKNGGTAKVGPLCLPNGGIKGINPRPNALATTWETGRFRIPTSAFTLRGKSSMRQKDTPNSPGHPYTAKVIGVDPDNPVALQVLTNFQIQVPFPSATSMGTMTPPTRGLYVHLTGAPPAKARNEGGMSGRTGPDTVTFCVGSTATVRAGNNPACKVSLYGGATIPTCGPTGVPGVGCPGPVKKFASVPGLMRYKRTNKMLGGPANGKLNGKADAVISAPGGGAFIVPLDINVDPAIGGSFGQYFMQNPGKGPHFKNFKKNECGIIQTLMSKDGDKVGSNRTSASFGGPLTQGSLTVRAPTAQGIESYMLKGYDKRTSMGLGKLQLVVGSISKRSLSGSNANHGRLNFNIPEPATAAGTVAALLVLAACHRAANRRR